MTKMLRVLVLLFITSCSTAIKNSSDYDFLLYDATLKEDVIPNSNSSSVVTKEEDLLGYWVGWTQAKDSADWYHANEHTISDGSYKILISFDSIVDNDIIGHTVVANQYNRFEASAYQSNGIWEIFIGSNIRRSDTSNEFKHYKASSEAVHKLNASQYKLKPHDLENLSQEDLLVLRNSIYARHGYSFKDFKLMVYFMKQPWYLPIYSNIQTKFTKRELHNIELILRYEEHAKSYYDRFGRG